MDFDATMLDIGREKQLFLDDLIIESAENIARTWHEPVRTDEKPVLSKDRPWEHVAYFTCNSWQVIKDPGDELYVYHRGSRNHHDWWITGGREGLDVPEARDMSQVDYSLGLAKLRLDGYVSLGATVRPGILITRPLISDGAQLTVNARCRTGGSIAAEIVGCDEKVLPGFGQDQCDVFSGDDVRHTFTWQGKAGIPVAATERAEYPRRERLRKIRFYVNNAELYSLALT